MIKIKRIGKEIKRCQKKCTTLATELCFNRESHWQDIGCYCFCQNCQISWTRTCFVNIVCERAGSCRFRKERSEAVGGLLRVGGTEKEFGTQEAERHPTKHHPGDENQINNNNCENNMYISQLSRGLLKARSNIHKDGSVDTENRKQKTKIWSRRLRVSVLS